jgi:hypothetical protein
MRTNLCIFIAILVSIASPIVGNELAHNTRIYNFGVSLGVASGCTMGLGKIQNFEKKSKEITYNYHYLQSSDYFVTGVYYQINTYRNIRREGFFTLLAGGLDYTKGKDKPFVFPGVIGGSSGEDDEYAKFEGVFPNIFAGCGYSIKLSQSSRMLIYLDLGIKKTILNLNTIVTF